MINSTTSAGATSGTSMDSGPGIELVQYHYRHYQVMIYKSAFLLRVLL